MAGPYEILGVPRDADRDAIRAAYRRAAKKAHPDHGGSPEKFRRLCAAHDLLTDERRRAHYDRTGEELAATVDNDHAEAVAMLANAFDGALDECSRACRDATKVDMVEMMRGRLKRDIAHRKDERQKMKVARSAFSALAGRFHAENGPNVLENFVQQKLRLIEANVAAMDRMDKAAERALKLLDDFSYRFDAEVTMFIQHQFFGGTSTSTTI